MQHHNFGSRKIPSMRLPSDKERESYPIDQWFDRSSDRYGHLVTPGSRPSKIGPLQISGFAEPDELGKPGAHDSVIENTALKSPIRRILIPIDATQVKSADLKPVLKVAQRFDAEVTLLHCYEIPLRFHYAVSRSALMDVVRHRDLVSTQLLQLYAEVRKFFPSCRSEFTFGSLPVEILRASKRLQSDLIVVPLALDSWQSQLDYQRDNGRISPQSRLPRG